MKKIHTAVILLVVIAACILGYNGPWQKYKTKVSGDVLKEALVSQISETTGLSDDQIQDVINVIPMDQQEEIVRIVAEHVTPSSLRKVMELAENGDGDGLMEYAGQEFSQTEIEEVEQIVMTNKDAVGQKLAEYGVTAEKMEDLFSTVAG